MIENFNTKSSLWRDLLSPKIFIMDSIDSFRFRSTQTIFSLLTSILFLGLGSLGFIYEANSNVWALSSIFFLSFLYLPLVLSALIWFRGFAIYDLTLGVKYEETKPVTKKDLKASLSFKIVAFSFLFYYSYGVYRVGGAIWSMSILCSVAVFIYLSKSNSYSKKN